MTLVVDVDRLVDRLHFVLTLFGLLALFVLRKPLEVCTKVAVAVCHGLSDVCRLPEHIVLGVGNLLTAENGTGSDKGLVSARCTLFV